MTISVTDWIAVLRDWGTLASVPLAVGGLGLMLFGWRLWRICVLIAFGLVGSILGSNLTQDGQSPWFHAICLGVVLGGLAYWKASQSIVVLGGLLGAGIATYTLSASHLNPSVLWLGGGLGFFCAAALAFINRRHLVIGVTSVLGAVLFISGLVAAVMALPALYGTFQAMASYSSIVVPFLLVVPAVMSCFYQVSEVHRIREDL